MRKTPYTAKTNKTRNTKTYTYDRKTLHLKHKITKPHLSMFGLFKKKNTELPTFEAIRNSALCNLYFGRCKPWNWLNDEMIYVIDPHSAKHITMDPWFQQIYLRAEGQITFLQFAEKMAGMYSKREGIPNGLDEMFLNFFEKMCNEEQLLKTSDTPFELEINYKLTMSEYAKWKESAN